MPNTGGAARTRTISIPLDLAEEIRDHFKRRVGGGNPNGYQWLGTRDLASLRIFDALNDAIRRERDVILNKETAK